MKKSAIKKISRLLGISAVVYRKTALRIVCFIFFALFAAKDVPAQRPGEFNQFTFCENIRDIFANSTTNFTNSRRPDWQSQITIDLLEGYLTHHQEFIVNNGDTQNVQWDYRCELTSSKHHKAQEDLKLFVSRILHCDDTVKLHVVSSTNDKDSLRADPGCPSRYSDLAVMAELLEPNTRNGGYWLHIVVYNSLKEYSYAAELEAHRQHDQVMDEAIARDKESKETHVLKIPDFTTLCNGVEQLINSNHHDNWKSLWTTHYTNSETNAWVTNMKILGYTVNIAEPSTNQPEYTAMCTLVRDPSDKDIVDLFNIIGGQLENCTIGGQHPKPLENGVENYFKSWYVVIDPHTSAELMLNARHGKKGYAFVRLDVRMVTK